MSKANLYLIGATEKEIHESHGFCQKNGFKLHCYSQEKWQELMSGKWQEGNEEVELIPGQVKGVPSVPPSPANTLFASHFQDSNQSDQGCSESDKGWSEKGKGHSESDATSPVNVIPFNREELLSRNSDSSILSLTEMEREAITEAIALLKGNLTEVAEALGIGRATLYRKIKTYKIDVQSSRQRKVA